MANKEESLSRKQIPPEELERWARFLFSLYKNAKRKGELNGINK